MSQKKMMKVKNNFYILIFLLFVFYVFICTRISAKKDNKIKELEFKVNQLTIQYENYALHDSLNQ